MCKIALTSPGAKFKQDGETDSAYKFPILFREVIVIRKKKKNIFRVGNLLGTDTSGSKRVPTRSSSIMAKSHEGTFTQTGSLNRLAP